MTEVLTDRVPILVVTLFKYGTDTYTVFTCVIPSPLHFLAPKYKGENIELINYKVAYYINMARLYNFVQHL